MNIYETRQQNFFFQSPQKFLKDIIFEAQMNRLRVLANQLNVESDLDNGNAIVPMKTSSSDQLPTTTCIQLKRIDENTLSVVLNRPNRLNAVDFTMREDFHKLLHFLEGSDKIRVVLLSANGKGFCAG